MGFEEIRETLKQIGLGHNESKIYLTLIKLGPSMAGRIAKEANIDRSACYDSLKALNKKGLVVYVIEANRKKFTTTNPSRLKEYLKEKESLVDEVLPGLKEMFKLKEEKSQVSMYRGVKGLKAVFEDILEEARNSENLVIDSQGQFREKMPFYAPHYLKCLEKNKIKVRRLVRKGKEKKIHHSKTTIIRFFPGNISETPITTNIYSDKIALILWTDVPEAVVIKNKAAHDAYKDYFEMLWKSAKA
jgi:sugar-specific transcriptional regulator TrmB